MSFGLIDEQGPHATRVLNSYHLNCLLPTHGIACAMGFIVPAMMSITKEDLDATVADGTYRQIPVPGDSTGLDCLELGEYDLLVFECHDVTDEDYYVIPDWALGCVLSRVVFPFGTRQPPMLITHTVGESGDFIFAAEMLTLPEPNGDR